jgi:tRNA(fMet)-specific endonuclease VapC
LTVSVRSLSRLPILSFSAAAILRCKTLQASRLNVRKMDLCIAAIALEAHAIVVTRNVRDFERVPNLDVVDWSK